MNKNYLSFAAPNLDLVSNISKIVKEFIFCLICREYVCIPIAQAFHWYEIRLKMMTLNVGGKISKVPKLNEAKAIEQGQSNLSKI